VDASDPDASRSGVGSKLDVTVLGERLIIL
jgi:hypothetical protein